MASCNHGPKPDSKKPVRNKKANKVSSADTTEKPIIQYTDQQLEFFLDSIGKLSTQLLTNKEAFYPDSIFQKSAAPWYNNIIERS